MTYAFIIVFFVALTLKLCFMSFSLYFTMKNGEKQLTQTNVPANKSMVISWKRFTQQFLPRSLYCVEENNKNFVNKM